MNVLRPFKLINWRIVLAALFGVGILHILATLAAPSFAIATAFDRLKSVLPVNRIVAMPKVEPNAQPLPFLSPAQRYAMCRFDTGVTPIDVAADLGSAGSSLTIYSPEGEAIYTAAESDVGVHRVRIISPDGRFLGLTPEARGRQSAQVATATLNAQTGIVVLAVPAQGDAYAAVTARQLTSAACAPAIPD